MKQELWLARDDDGCYAFFDGEPEKRSGVWLIAISTFLKPEFDGDEFHAIFGCHPLRKGRKKCIKRILIELED